MDLEDACTSTDDNNVQNLFLFDKSSACPQGYTMALTWFKGARFLALGFLYLKEDVAVAPSADAPTIFHHGFEFLTNFSCINRFVIPTYQVGIEFLFPEFSIITIDGKIQGSPDLPW